MHMTKPILPVEGMVMWIDLLLWEFHLSNVVEEDLSVAELPVTEEDHEERSKLQDVEGAIVQGVV